VAERAVLKASAQSYADGRVGTGPRIVSELLEEVAALEAELAAAQERADTAFDAGRESVLGEVVCSVCGWNHDRDESAACEGCEAVRFDEWVAALSGGSPGAV
jgi:hypothetical protein